MSADTTSILSDRDGLLEGQHVLKVSSGLGDGSALNGLTNLTGVLELDSQVSSLALAAAK